MNCEGGVARLVNVLSAQEFWIRAGFGMEGSSQASPDRATSKDPRRLRWTDRIRFAHG
jgi:hypothetical protein